MTSVAMFQKTTSSTNLLIPANNGFFSLDNQLIWDWATKLKLASGLHEFYYSFPMLPLRPGPCSWHVILWEDGGLLDEWVCRTRMIVGTEIHQRSKDDRSGVPNVPCRFVVNQKGGHMETVRPDHIVGLGS